MNAHYTYITYPTIIYWNDVVCGCVWVYVTLFWKMNVFETLTINSENKLFWPYIFAWTFLAHRFGNRRFWVHHTYKIVYFSLHTNTVLVKNEWSWNFDNKFRKIHKKREYYVFEHFWLMGVAIDDFISKMCAKSALCEYNYSRLTTHRASSVKSLRLSNIHASS